MYQLEEVKYPYYLGLSGGILEPLVENANISKRSEDLQSLCVSLVDRIFHWSICMSNMGPNKSTIEDR